MSPKKQLSRKQDASGQGKPTETIVPALESSATVQGQLILDQEQWEEVKQMASEDAIQTYMMVNSQAKPSLRAFRQEVTRRLFGPKSARTSLPPK